MLHKNKTKQNKKKTEFVSIYQRRQRKVIKKTLWENLQ